jgi:GWxTD domain-containing protein
MRRPFVRVLKAALGCAAFAGASALFAQPVRGSEDWADSPEAYFLTAAERAEWKTLDSREARHAFQERYWLKRDPSAGSERNEFRELVLARIATADKRWPIEGTPGSRTNRGFLFIVFGGPARIRDEHAPQPSRFRSNAGGFEGTETVTTWIWDRERTPHILDALGRPSFEVEIIVEPTRHGDAIHSPGLVKEMREKIAAKSIVNPDLVAAASGGSALPAGGGEPASSPALAHAALDPAVRAVLESAPAASRPGAAVFGSAVLWRTSGNPEALVWFHLPPTPPGHKRRLAGIVRRENGGEEVASISEPAATSNAFSSAAPGEVLLRRLDLPTGIYDAAFAVLEDGAAQPVASASCQLAVPDLAEGFAVSPLLVTRGPAAAAAGSASPSTLGGTVVPPRSDATFAASESLWAMIELANAPDPSKVTIETRLRKGAEVVESKAPFPAGAQAIADGRALAGFEVPLEDLDPGDYRLYVLVRDGVGPADRYVLRSADFRVK